MNILTRYILSELVKWFAMALSAMTLLILVFFVAQEAVSRGLPLSAVLRLIPYFLPETLSLAVPGTLLLAATSVYGRLAGWNEIVAIKSQGISPRKILAPMWAMAFLLSLSMVFVNDLGASWGRNGQRRVVVESVEQIAYGLLQTKHQWTFGDISVYVKSVDDRKLVRPRGLVKSHDNSPGLRIEAEDAEFQSNRQGGELKLVFRKARVVYDGGFEMNLGDDPFPITIPIQESRPSTKPSEIALRAIPSETLRQQALIEKEERRLAAGVACQMLCGDFEALAGAQWAGNAKGLRTAKERLFRLEAEPYRRWAAGFSCLCFAWVGAPMAIRLRNRDMLTSFFLCFMPILLVYYPLLILGLNGAKDGRLPPWSVWSGNLLMIAWGAYLLRRVIRY